jgi:hypothetical protein
MARELIARERTPDHPELHTDPLGRSDPPSRQASHRLTRTGAPTMRDLVRKVRYPGIRWLCRATGGYYRRML